MAIGPVRRRRTADLLRRGRGEQGSGELHWFSAAGQWIRSRGGPGDGPGEFRRLRRILRLPGDSPLAEDGLSSRMTSFDNAGTLVRTVMLPAHSWSRRSRTGTSLASPAMQTAWSARSSTGHRALTDFRTIAGVITS